jgi:hypothetical protein
MANKRHVLTTGKVSGITGPTPKVVPNLVVTQPDDSLTPQPSNFVAKGTVDPAAGTTLTAWVIDGWGNKTLQGPVAATSPWTLTFNGLAQGYYLFTVVAVNGPDHTSETVPFLVG